MIGYENTDFYEDQQQTELEPVTIQIPRFVFANALVYLGMALGMLIVLGGCAVPSAKDAVGPPYIDQRPDNVEVTPSGYLRNLEAE